MGHITILPFFVLLFNALIHTALSFDFCFFHSTVIPTWEGKNPKRQFIGMASELDKIDQDKKVQARASMQTFIQ